MSDEINRVDPLPKTVEIEMTPAVGQLMHAMSKAQGEMKEAKKTAENKFFDTMYADYADIWRVVQKPLADNELTLMHFPQQKQGAAGVISLLGHSSGEWIKSTFMFGVPTDKDGGRRPITYGTVVSYAKRYSTQAICNIAADEDEDMQSIEHPKIDPSYSDKLVERLMHLGKDEAAGKANVTRFCKKFGIETVNDLTIDKIDEAEAAIAAKEKA